MIMQRQQGFTLPEAIMVIVITGIIAGVVAVFIRAPMQSYFDMETRVELTDTADTALRRIGRDLRLALPNSARVSGNIVLELLQTRTGGRYVASLLGGSVLDYTGTSFNVLPGSMPIAPVAGDSVVIYNLGQGIPGADAYAGDNIAPIKSVGTNAITLTTAFDFPLDSPGRRFQVVESPVTYLCDLTAGTLRRYWGYAINATQPNPPSGGNTQSALLAQGVTGCAFTYDAVSERMGLVTLTLSLTRNNETVTLYHEVHVNNVP
ncbi:MAG: prepilin-type N-terminal cleavage/methylation protein [Burkholderiaceae bacterium]|nr:prepilin-type N-terminal cleavage/methylation protein [Burkholderiaceae bacterium]